MIIDWNEKPEDTNAYYWTAMTSNGGRGTWFNAEKLSSDVNSSNYTVTERSLLERKTDKFNLWVADLNFPLLSGWNRLAGTCLVNPDGGIYDSAFGPFEECQGLHVHIPPGVFVEGLNSRPKVAQLPNDHLIRDSAGQSDPIPDPSPQQLKAWIDSLSEELAKIQEEHNKLRAEVAGSLIDEAKHEAKQVEPEVAKWEPAGGQFAANVGVGMSAMKVDASYRFYQVARAAGHLRPTRESAEKSSAMIRSYSRLLAYVDEHKGDWEADWDDWRQEKWMVYQRSDDQYWSVIESPTEMPVLGTVYMPELVARELADRLNKGEVEF